MDYKSTLERIIQFRNDRDWKQFHTAENLSKSIVIEAAELLENFQWGDDLNIENMKEEIADILIYAFLFADAINVDALAVINEKLSKNELRFPVEKVKGNSGKDTKVSITDEN